ncbi:trypsin-like peptidase domain-containing protein, partial [Candidatus Roizmanbacteria bacterium]|nr:trypsin-like peptidase domain-containing protein [Candidatus Roizmanbacteria bacterium]
MKRNILFIIIALLLLAVGISSGAFGFGWQDANTYLNQLTDETRKTDSGVKISEESVRLIDEESAVIEVIEEVSPSVVTVGVVRERPVLEYDPFDPFGFFSAPRELGTELEEADIGSGFIISEDGLIVTNRHVVDEPGYDYKVITSDNTTYDVQNVYRDPVNDLAILKIDPSAGSGQVLKPVTLGDSDNLKVGQTVIALGTPLGEFRGTATKGIVSGLGRGITAGSPFEGMAEELDDVIQTDAAINPGNSGGPLLNTSSQVIGVNTAVASDAENIGFALPINIVKEAVANFEETGSFDRAFLGVSYRMVTREISVMNDIPEGAYVLEVVEDSSAARAEIQAGDIITHFDGQRVRDQDGERLADRINQKRQGDTVSITVWRNGEELSKQVQLGEF